MREPIPRFDRLQIEYVDLDVLRKWPGNPKQHDISAISESVLRWGFRDPITINVANGNFIEEGHGRLDTLAGLKQQRRPAPRFIHATGDGRWLVPVIKQHDDELAQRGYMLASNRTQELGGGYVDPLLYGELLFQAGHGALMGTGFDGDDLDALARKLNEESGMVLAGASAKYQVVVDCESEDHQGEVLERLQAENLRARARTT